MDNFKEESLLENNIISEKAKDNLRETHPWIKFFAIIMFVFTGLITLGAIGIIFMGLGIGMGMNSFVAVFYLLFAALYGVFGSFLYNYAKGIKDAINYNDMFYLEEAFRNQKNFWKVSGIMTSIFLGLYLIIIVFAIMVSGAAGLSQYFS